MRILADENIPVVDAFFADQGSIRRLPGRAIDRAALAEVDVLLVRSVTEVSRAALAGSPVRFVGTCTIGTDHLDLDYFAEAGIAWSSAPGCNARGVVDYVLGCLLAMAEVRGADLAERTYGVVGAGQVGGRLVEVLRGLGWKVLVCDPPRQAREPDGEFVSLERLLAEADVISLHTPLNRDGEHPTRHLLDEPRLAALRPGTWLVNASRGAVVDNQHRRTREPARRAAGNLARRPATQPRLRPGLGHGHAVPRGVRPAQRRRRLPPQLDRRQRQPPRRLRRPAQTLPAAPRDHRPARRHRWTGGVAAGGAGAGGAVGVGTCDWFDSCLRTYPSNCSGVSCRR